MGLEAMLISLEGVQLGAHVPFMPEEDAAEAGGHDAHLASRNYRGYRDTHYHS